MKSVSISICWNSGQSETPAFSSYLYPPWSWLICYVAWMFYVTRQGEARSPSVCWSYEVVELVYSPSDSDLHHLPSWSPECLNWYAQQVLLPWLQMGFGFSNSSWDIPKMGTSRDGPTRHIQQQKVPLIVLNRKPMSPFLGRCLFLSLDRGPSSNTTNCKSDEQDQSNAKVILIVPTWLGQTWYPYLFHLCPTSIQASGHPSFPLPGCRLCVSLQPRGPPPLSVAPR